MSADLTCGTPLQQQQQKQAQAEALVRRKEVELLKAQLATSQKELEQLRVARKVSALCRTR